MWVGIQEFGDVGVGGCLGGYGVGTGGVVYSFT